MTWNIFKLLSLFFCCTYISVHLFKFSIKCKMIKINYLSIFLTILAYITNLYYPTFRYAFPLLALWLVTSLLSHNPQISFIITTISFGLSFGLHVISGTIGLIFLFPWFNKFSDFPFVLLAILSSLLQITLTIGLFRLKRFRNGIPFLTHSFSINIATIICLFSCGCAGYMIFNYKHVTLRWGANLLFILTLAFLIYWWQAQITKAYRRSLELRELESLRTEMAELKLKFQEVVDEKDRLARIVHRDNTLISALKNATVKSLSTDFANPAVAAEVRNQLIENINTLSAERASIMDTHKEVSVRDFDTGISLLDELLREMDKKALDGDIIFSVHMGTSLDSFIPKDISESDLVHTVDDLLKNAFKATAGCEKRIVQLQFYKLSKSLVVEVADNGIPFEVRSLVNMGIEKLTTYADGSGIGLMDIWSTKEKYGATYHLEEYLNADPFSKKISFTLDKKNRYSIRTFRKDEILQAARRADLQVYDFSE